ncbi:MAG: hypothetical protein AAGA74_07715 [Pseudomonadota bacterium]
MSRKSEILTAIATLGCAVGVGFVMQSGEEAELRYGPKEPSASSVPLVGTPANASTAPVQAVVALNATRVLEVNDITLTSVKVDASAETAAHSLKASLQDDARSDISDAGTVTQTALNTQDACVVQGDVQSGAGAILHYTLEATCLVGAPVGISHAGLQFHEVIPSNGILTVSFPALTEQAKINAEFENGMRHSVQAVVDTVALYDRFVMQWAGNTGIQVHAREHGADYGTDGHVWSGAARDVSALADGRGGFLVGLGRPQATENARIAEVYTFPLAKDADQPAVHLTVETEVTPANCGSDVVARALQFKAGKEVSSQLLSLSVPGCDAVGSFLVLNNLLQDLTVASK